LAFALSTGCWAHDVAQKQGIEAGFSGPKLVGPMRGRYLITREDERIGEESFVLTSSAGVWSARGEVTIEAPVEQKEGYVLQIDARTLEPLAFSMWIEIVGERESAKGARVGDAFEVRTTGISGEHRQDLGWVPGTMIDFASPVFHMPVLALISHVLRVGSSIPVRALRVSLPALDASIQLETYELRGNDGDVRKVAVESAGRHAIALWVRTDGLPIKARVWIDEGPPFELVLAN
jgi:hypothetical protein